MPHQTSRISLDSIAIILLSYHCKKYEVAQPSLSLPNPRENDDFHAKCESYIRITVLDGGWTIDKAENIILKQ